MKTKNEFAASSMTVSLDDVIFTNRNRAYGAYNLRKSYSKHLFLAFIITTFFLAGVGVPYLKYKFFTNKTLIVSPIILDVIPFDPEQIVVPPPPPPPKEPTNEELKPAQNNSFVPIDTIQPNSNKEIPLVSEPYVDINNEPPTVEYIPKPESGDGLGIDDDSGQIIVQEQARFQGGDVGTFRDWVEKNVTYPQSAQEAGIEGKVFMHFAINSKGKMCDVSISRGVHPSIDSETIRIFLNSPDWEPARQNGKVVKQQFTIPITFKLQ